MAAALLAVVAVVLGAVLIFKPSDSPGASGKSSGAQVSADDVSSCAKPPTLHAESVDFRNGGLTLTTHVSPSCPSGDLLSNNRLRITVADAAGRDVAAGVFDLSSTPVPVGSDGRSVTFTFPPGTYWRTADTITGDVTMVAFNDGQNSAGAKTVAGSAFTATGAAAPASGDIDSAAQSALVDIAAADRAFIDANLLNIWQPQLSSKRPGLYADGISWNYPEIVREHLQLRQRYPGARLVWSGDWPVYNDGTWWVTVSGVTFDSGPAALDWCSSQGFDSDHCFAKILSHTMGTSGTTLLRR